MAWTDETCVVDGDRIHYLTAGDPDDPSVVLLHGGIIDAAHVSWGEVIDPLAEDFRVVAPDLLGYGESDKPDRSYAMAMHVDVIEEFLAEIECPPATLVGISMGGGVALGLALRAPDRAERLAVLDSYGLGTELANGRLTSLLSRVQVFNRIAVALFARSRRFTKASLGSIAHDPDALSAEAVDAVWEEAGRPGVGKAFRRFRASEVTRGGYRTDYTDRLDEIDQPVLLLHGEHDEVFPPEWSQRAAERLPDAECEILADCAHWAPRERPAAVIERIRSFAPA